MIVGPLVRQGVRHRGLWTSRTTARNPLRPACARPLHEPAQPERDPLSSAQDRELSKDGRAGLRNAARHGTPSLGLGLGLGTAEDVAELEPSEMLRTSGLVIERLPADHCREAQGLDGS